METDRSFGIEVAHLAGLPEEIIMRAKNIMGEITNGETQQTTLFQKPIHSENENNVIMDVLKRLKVEALTPMDAINILNDLAKKAQNG